MGVDQPAHVVAVVGGDPDRHPVHRQRAHRVVVEGAPGLAEVEVVEPGASVAQLLEDAHALQPLGVALHGVEHEGPAAAHRGAVAGLQPTGGGLHVAGEVAPGAALLAGAHHVVGIGVLLEGAGAAPRHPSAVGVAAHSAGVERAQVVHQLVHGGAEPVALAGAGAESAAAEGEPSAALADSGPGAGVVGEEERDRLKGTEVDPDLSRRCVGQAHPALLGAAIGAGGQLQRADHLAAQRHLSEGLLEQVGAHRARGVEHPALHLAGVELAAPVLEGDQHHRQGGGAALQLRRAHSQRLQLAGEEAALGAPLSAHRQPLAGLERVEHSERSRLQPDQARTGELQPGLRGRLGAIGGVEVERGEGPGQLERGLCGWGTTHQTAERGQGKGTRGHGGGGQMQLPLQRPFPRDWAG
jgi:hypothetical protein